MTKNKAIKAKEKSQEQIDYEWRYTAEAYASVVKRYSEAERTEARRIARNAVKSELKRQGVKISHVEADAITKAAIAYTVAEPRKTLTVARRTIRRRERIHG